MADASVCTTAPSPSSYTELRARILLPRSRAFFARFLAAACQPSVRCGFVRGVKADGGGGERVGTGSGGAS